MKNLAKKLLNVMKECSHILKNGENSFHGYKYATSADVLEKVNASLVKEGICSIAVPEVLSIMDVTNAKGNTEHLATVKMDIMLVDKDSGECASITGIGSGQDGGDKAVMKAQTAAIKYAYMLSLAISTGDDPEADVKTDENSAAPVKAKQSSQQSKKQKIAGGLQCQNCHTEITDRVKTYSEGKYGRALCMECQKNAKGAA